MDGVAYCGKCAGQHHRPVGRQCEFLQAMATVVQSGNHDDTSVTTLGQNLENPQPGTSAKTQSVNQEEGNGVLLAELRELASRMNRFEAEFNLSQSDTRTLTPRIRKKARKNQGGSHSLADSQLSLNESHIHATVMSAPNIAIATSSAVMVNAGSAATSYFNHSINSKTTFIYCTSYISVNRYLMEMPPTGVPVVGAQEQLAGNISSDIHRQVAQRTHQTYTNIPGWPKWSELLMLLSFRRQLLITCLLMNLW